MDYEFEGITGRMLQRLRVAKGFAQKEVAAKLQITQQAYCKLEHKKIIKTSTLKCALIAMESNIQELVAITLLFQKEDYS